MESKLPANDKTKQRHDTTKSSSALSCSWSFTDILHESSTMVMNLILGFYKDNMQQQEKRTNKSKKVGKTDSLEKTKMKRERI